MELFIHKNTAVLFLLLFGFCSHGLGQHIYRFQDQSLGTEERILNLISHMTLDEKVNALSTNPKIPRLGIVGTGHVEGLHGLALGGPAEWGGENPVPTTTFPQAYGLGETWDRELLEKVAEIESYEARYIFQKYGKGGLVVRAPNADLSRDPRWGRTEESFGEDQFLTGELVTSFVKGLQGNDPKYWRSASLMKHFLANSNEDGRTYTSSNFDEKLLRGYYAYPFEEGVKKGGSRAYMTAYNKINGVPAMVNTEINNLAIEDWGQNGIICTDGGALRLLITDHKYYENAMIGAAEAVKAGTSQFLDDYKEAIYGALGNGYLEESDIDKVIQGNYRVMLKLGFLDNDEKNPYTKIGKREGDTIDPWLTEDHKRIAREATQKSVVLLKNKDRFLPFKKDIKTLALIGDRVDEVLLDWYSGTPSYSITPLQGITEKLSERTKILVAKNNADGSAEKIAREADYAIVILGNHPTCNAGWADCPRPSEGKESVDRQSLELENEDLVKIVHKANQNTLLVLISSFPYSINWSDKNLPGIIHMTQNSQELGNGLADVVFGDYNPAGRLTQTWVREITDLPPLLDYDIRKGRTYKYLKKEPLYPFGYGLSYSHFKYENLEVKRGEDDSKIKVSIDVQNDSAIDGEEVVQLYMNYKGVEDQEKTRQLVGFERIFLSAKESQNVQFEISRKELKKMIYPTGRIPDRVITIDVGVGKSSANMEHSKTIKL